MKKFKAYLKIAGAVLITIALMSHVQMVMAERTAVPTFDTSTGSLIPFDTTLPLGSGASPIVTGFFTSLIASNTATTRLSATSSTFGTLTATTATTTNLIASSTNISTTTTVRIQGTNTPTFSTSTGIGTRGTTTPDAGSSDLGGFITVITGPSPTAFATITRLTFSNSNSRVPFCVFSPASTSTIVGVATGTAFIRSTTTPAYDIFSGSMPLAANNIYAWSYICH